MPFEGFVKLTAKGARWTGDVRLVPEHLADPLRWRQPSTVFANSMSDLFHEELSNEQIAAVFGIMAACPMHTFQCLTKRAKRMREWFEWVEERIEADSEEWSGRECGVSIHDARAQERALLIADCAADELGDGSEDNKNEWYMRLSDRMQDGWARHGSDGGTEWLLPWPLPNVWLGVSTENQEAADERIPELLATPAAVRFLSCEPLLGKINLHASDDGLHHWLPDFGPRYTREGVPVCQAHGSVLPHRGCAFVDWVIVGCESGPVMRDCDPAWLRFLRDQCANAGVPYYLKQAKPWDEGRHRVVPMGIGYGPGSKRKAGGVVELPYLDGALHSAWPR